MFVAANRTKKQGPSGPVLIFRPAIASAVIAVMVVVMMVMVSPEARRHHDDAGYIPAKAVVMVMVVMMMVLGQLDILIGRRRRSGFINHLQQSCGVRDRLEKLGE
jgi:ABC-type transport system involved in cytochrome bd biosynthesis fused ATPase/permease subunit